jgi:hypothetical protein
MKNEKRFEALIMRARGETFPSVDVADRVIAILAAEHGRIDEVSDRPLMWLAALSSAVAVPVLLIAISVYNEWSGPLSEISRAISWVTQ